ncbi:MAG: histidyl-tRNA synthetase [Acidobacteriota bacterium]|nr:histidyl-tRNA synthetase [Acidobacteriota bacterium]
MRDFLPADVRRREYVMRVIKETYERYGFEPLETPAVENIETLMGKYGEEGNQLIFKILKRGEHERTGEADLALRYDLTVPLARVVAEYGDKLPRFFKRYQIQPVWRADRPARGRFREFYQCDVDCIGTRSPVVEAELCAAASDALTALGFQDFTIRLNHRQVLAGVLEKAGIASDKHADALIALDKLDKVGREGVIREFEERKIFSTEEGKRVVGLLLDVMFTWATKGFEEIEIQVRGYFNEKEIADVNEQSLLKLGEFMAGHSEGKKGLDELRQILELVNKTPAKGKVEIDASLARGLSYYTGAIMEVNVPDLAGSLGGGGRYDNLVGMFSGKDIPACGFSLGLERIIVVMNERGMFPADLERAAADCLVTVWNEESIKDSLAFASELRKNEPRLRVDVYPEADKLGKQLKYASARGVPFVVVIGDDERARGEVALKELKTGEQRTVKREEVGVLIHETLINGPAAG